MDGGGLIASLIGLGLILWFALISKSFLNVIFVILSIPYGLLTLLAFFSGPFIPLIMGGLWLWAAAALWGHHDEKQRKLNAHAVAPIGEATRPPRYDESDWPTEDELRERRLRYAQSLGGLCPICSKPMFYDERNPGALCACPARARLQERDARLGNV